MGGMARHGVTPEDGYSTLSPACMFHILEITPRGGYPVAIDSDVVMETYSNRASFGHSASTPLALPCPTPHDTFAAIGDPRRVIGRSKPCT